MTGQIGKIGQTYSPKHYGTDRSDLQHEHDRTERSDLQPEHDRTDRSDLQTEHDRTDRSVLQTGTQPDVQSDTLSETQATDAETDTADIK